jgi:hypothetical protein
MVQWIKTNILGCVVNTFHINLWWNILVVGLVNSNIKKYEKGNKV